MYLSMGETGISFPAESVPPLGGFWNRDDHGLHGSDGIGNVRAVRSMEKIRNAPQGMLEICGVVRTGVIEGKIIR